MKLDDIMKNIRVYISPVAGKDCYIAHVVGRTPSLEHVDFRISLECCSSIEVAMATTEAKLEELFESKYYYTFDGNTNEDDLLYDGGIYQ